MEIIVFINTLKNGGAEKQSVLLSKVLSKTYPTSLLVFYGDQYDQRLMDLARQNDIELILLKGSAIQKLSRIFKIFRKKRTGVVFSYLATTNLITGILGKLAGVKYLVGGIRNSSHSSYKLLLQKWNHNFLLDYTITNCYSGHKEIKQAGFTMSKVVTIHNGYVIQNFAGKTFGNKKAVVIISVGRFVSQKDYSTALLAIQHLKLKFEQKGSIHKFKYQIIGFGELKDEILSQITGLNLEEYVEVVENPAHLFDYYKSADIYLSSSIFEGLSNSILEAMEYSLPVVCTDVGDNSELVIQEHNGFLSEISDYQTLSDNLEKLINSHEMRKSFGSKSFEILMNKFSIDIFEQSYLSFISTKLLKK